MTPGVENFVFGECWAPFDPPFASRSALVRSSWYFTCLEVELMDARHALTFAVAILAATPDVGCTHVAPYERAKLAHPMMTATDLDGPAAGHVLAVHEGSTGGGPLSESGCGCN